MQLPSNGDTNTQIVWAPNRLKGGGSPNYTPSLGSVLVGPDINIFGITGYSDNPYPCYLQLFNNNVTPTPTVDIPDLIFPIGAGPGKRLPVELMNELIYPAVFSLGFAWALSVTRDVFNETGFDTYLVMQFTYSL